MNITFKKTLLLLAIGILFHDRTSLLAQENQYVIAKIHYEFTHIDDTLQPNNPYLEDIEVHISPQLSMQKSTAVIHIERHIHDFIYNPSSRD